MTKTAQNTHTESLEPHWIEWLTGAVSVLVVVAMMGWIGMEALMQTTAPPEFTVTVTKTEAIAGGYRVLFEISNAAETTAAAVGVRGEILENGNIEESSDVTFDYVPAESKATGAVFFRTDPTGKQLRVSPMGYTDP